MARRGENIYKRKDGRWEGRYVIGKKADGKTAFAYIYGSKYTEVKRKLEFCKVNRDEDSKKYFDRKIFQDGSIRAWLEYWLEEEIKPGIKQSTYAVYRGQIERHIIPIIGMEQLSRTGDDTIEKLYHMILQKGISTVTALQIIMIFRSALISAHNAHLLATLPALPWKKKKVIRKKPRFLGIHEQKLIEQNLDESKPKDLSILLSLYSGCRVGECSAFKWCDFDSLGGGIYVTHSVQRVSTYDQKARKTELLYTNPKSELSKRFIPLPSFMIEALKRFKEQRNAKEQDYIFGTEKKPMDPRVLQYHITKITKSLGIRGVHFHTLRHTFATRFMEKNRDVQVLKELLGHSSTKITMDWYGHTTEVYIKKTMQRLQKLSK